MKKLLVLLSMLVALPALAQNMYVDYGNASIVSKAGQDLKLKTGTSGLGLTIASATGSVTGGGAIAATTAVTAGTTVTAGTRLIGGTLGLTAEAVNAATPAAALSAVKSVHVVSASDETKAVALPACATADIGVVHIILNTVANKFVVIAPESGGTINGGSANATYATGGTGVGAGLTVCACTAAKTWTCKTGAPA
jgi:hypothetical protein